MLILGHRGASADFPENTQEAFAAANMGTVWQQFTHPVYPQPGTAPFIKGLSVLDLLFNCGPRAAEIARQPQAAEHELLAA